MKRFTAFCAFSAFCAFCFCAFLALTACADSVRQIQIENRFLILPICNSAQKQTVEITDENGVRLHLFEVTLANAPEQANWWSFLDVQEYTGKTLTLKSTGAGSSPESLALVQNLAEVPRREPLYAERLRPQLRFSQIQGWNNDPNGMVFWNGEFHLFWQSNPVGLPWGNMYWGHAVSKDLVHWEELPLALRPYGNELPKEKKVPSMAVGQCFSGCAVPAWDSGNGDLLAFFTDTAVGESLAVSHDAGRTWTYEGLLVPHRGRDPQLNWFPETKTWLMSVYDERDSERLIAFYQSKDRQNWERTGEISGFFECPNLNRMAVDGDPANTRWVLWAADGLYVVGDFDGKTFVPEHEGKFRVHYGQFYASQCFSNTPGRLVQIGWARIPMDENTPFNQAFTLPIELTLRTTPAGIRLFAEPVKELEVLRQESKETSAEGPATTIDLEGFGDGQLYEVEVTLDAAQNAAFVFGKNQIVWNASERHLDEMPLEPQEGKITFRVFIDRPMYEISAQCGAAYKTERRQDAGEKFQSFELRGAGTVKVWSLKSIH